MSSPPLTSAKTTTAPPDERAAAGHTTATVALIDNPRTLSCFTSSTGGGLPSGTLVQLWDVGVMQILSESWC